MHVYFSNNCIEDFVVVIYTKMTISDIVNVCMEKMHLSHNIVQFDLSCEDPS